MQLPSLSAAFARRLWASTWLCLSCWLRSDTAGSCILTAKRAARAAGNAGTAYILSTLSGYRLEDVKAASKGPMCYQLYLLGGRAASEAAIDRARVAGFSALIVTIDTAVSGIRERDFRNGMKELIGGGIFDKLPYLPNILSHPGWLVSYLLDGGLPALPNVVIPGKGPMPLLDVGAALAESTVTWADFTWIREHWGGPIVVKGVLTGDDAKRAIDYGAAAISVSNHGGRNWMEFSRPCVHCRRSSKQSAVRLTSGWTVGFAVEQTS